jgi:hypothetical protein
MMKERTSYAYRMQAELMTGPPVHNIFHCHLNIIRYHSIIHHAWTIKETKEASEEEDVEEEDLEETEDQ